MWLVAHQIKLQLIDIGYKYLKLHGFCKDQVCFPAYIARVF